ncbi:MAG TPA: CaiB/BaiF CoA-transferase family protein [Candidatus Dormibacteraeota bacterium]|nr:CaiB/BaiF CoA-transferase family protein [Candidatus Dormibacteraeota bacterium]
MSKPLQTLEGVRIAAFTQFLLGPAAVQHLADLGADVVKVETPAGGAWERHWAGAETFRNGVSTFFMLANRNQRSLALDLKSEAGREAALRLIARSDVVVANFRPGAMDRLGLGYEAARKARPDIIYATASGYGSDSPFRDLPGQDLLIQGLSGVAWLTGRAGSDPTVVGAAVVDQHGGALLAMGILAALFHRERTGEGQSLEVAMVQAAFDLMTEPVVYAANGAKLQRPREEIADTFHSAPYGVYRTADGHAVISMVPVKMLVEVLGEAPLKDGLDDPAVAFGRRDEIRAVLGPLVAKHTTAGLVERLRAHHIWCAPVQTIDEALADPAVRHLDPFLEMNHPRAGTVKALRHPVRYGAGEPALRRLPPEVGEQSREILRELGYSDEEAARITSS